jgi:hypothetical protein
MYCSMICVAGFTKYTKYISTQHVAGDSDYDIFRIRNRNFNNSIATNNYSYDASDSKDKARLFDYDIMIILCKQLSVLDIVHFLR